MCINKATYVQSRNKTIQESTQNQRSRQINPKQYYYNPLVNTVLKNEMNPLKIK